MSGGARAKLVRQYLKDTGGATLADIAKAMGIAIATLAGKDGVIAQMPDAYIDRWETRPDSLGVPHHVAVWCVVDVPPHCPKPTKRRKKDTS